MSKGVSGIPPRKAVQTTLREATSSPSSFGYSHWDGELDLWQALVGEMKIVYGEGSDINIDDVALTLGCNLAFAAVAMATADPWNEVIPPVPW